MFVLSEKEKQEALKYHSFIEGAEDAIIQAADNEKSYAVIMKIMHGTETTGPYPDYNEHGTSDRLKAGPRSVYNFLKEKNFKPTLVYGHDGGGIESWWELRANWSTLDDNKNNVLKGVN
ncbi:hypothetical protein D3C80_1703700 [compost metagenome]